MAAEHWYRGHGLTIRSALALPEFTPVDPATQADVILALGPEPGARRDAFLETAEGAGGAHRRLVLRSGDCALLTFPGIAAVEVRAGREIVVAPDAGHDPGLLRLFLIGSAMGMLLHQRGLVVLHGAAVLQPRGLSVFVGDSGAGKSTLAAHLGAAGHAVLADDTLALHARADGRFEAWPGSRVFKLWQDALDGLGTAAEGLNRVASRETKFFFDNARPAPDAPAPLAEIILLDRAGPDTTAPRMTPLSPIEALGTITAHLYRPEYVAMLDRRPDSFRDAAHLSGQIPAWRLSRPWDLAAMPAVLDLLARHWSPA